MKKLLTLIILILFTPLVLAQTNYNFYEDLTIDFSLNSDITLDGAGSLKSLLVTILIVPLEDSIQSVNSFLETSNPGAEIDKSEEKIEFSWTEQVSDYEFGYNSIIKTKNQLFKVPEVNFPYEDLPEEYNQYLNSEEIIDINSEIIQQASEIIENEDNAYLAVHEIADWVYNNIEYDLNTVTATAAKQSSWVLENEQGVCDEISALFISMVRSIGIPARFVSGVAYTNVYDNFGNHGWAEVYYPEYGWVPYDVTFDQFGWIDPTHIALQKSADAGQSSITYKWESTGTLDLESGPIVSSGEITSKGNKMEKVFDIYLEAIEKEVAPGSYVPIRVRIVNPFSAYISDQIVITKATELTEKNVKVAALKPKQTKDLFWIVKIPSETEAGYIYTTTIEAKDLFESIDSTEITFSPNGNYKYISLEEAEEMIDALTVEDEDEYSNQVVLSCQPDKTYYYSSSQAIISCRVRSINSALNNLQACIKDSCETFSLSSNSEEIVSFQITPSNEPIVVTLENNDLSIKRIVLLNYVERPEVKITGVELGTINYDEPIDIPLSVSSKTPLKNLVIYINRFEPIEIEELDGTKTFTLSTNTKYFNSEKIKIEIEFEDEEGNQYDQTYEQEVQVNGLPWYWKLINLFRF